MFKTFCKAGKLFSVESWKMTECHFWANIMLRKPNVRAARVSPAQKLEGLRVVWSKNFSRATFLFSGEFIWSIDIWVICPWNKFEEKAQCEPRLELWLVKHMENWCSGEQEKLKLSCLKLHNTISTIHLSTWKICRLSLIIMIP